MKIAITPEQLHILAVDDEEHVLQILEELLGFLGYKVTAVSGGYEALKVFLRQRDAFNLIITDYSMPDINGLDLADWVRSVRSDIPIILVSAFISDISAKEIDNAGINVYLSKPFGLADLGNAIECALNPAASVCNY